MGEPNMKKPDDRHEDIMLAAALQYAERGWRVFPNHKPTINDDGTVTCSCGKTKCKPGKHPALGAWQKQASTKPSKIRSWWKRRPGTNIGIATGWDSDLIVLDVDVGQGFQHLRSWKQEDKFLPKTVTVRTGSGGLQFYFRYPDLDFDPKTKAKLDGNVGVDIRANGGQVVAPPSLHPSGIHYKWVDGCSPDDVAVADPPDWLIEMLRQDGKPLTEARLPRADSNNDEVPTPTANIKYLHPYLNPRLVRTKEGQPRRGLDGSLGKNWKAHPEDFAVERRIIAAIGDLWLPPEVRPRLMDDGLTLEVDDGGTLDYQRVRSGELRPRDVAGGRWVSDGKHSTQGKPVTNVTQTLGLLLGQVRLLVPWDYRVSKWGKRTERQELDTLLIPVIVLTPEREPLDVWEADAETRRRLVQPFAQAIQSIAGTADVGLQVSYWVDGENGIWIAIHTTDQQPKDGVFALRQSIVDLAAEAAPTAQFDGEAHGRRDSARTPEVVYRVGSGNLDSTPCPIPFSFCPQHPDRMMMAFDANTGEFYADQASYLLSLRRLPGLGNTLKVLPALETPAGQALSARQRVLSALGQSGGSDQYVDVLVRLLTTPDDVRDDWEIYVDWRNRRGKAQTVAKDGERKRTNTLAPIVADDAPIDALTIGQEADPAQLSSGEKPKANLEDSGEAHAADAGEPALHSTPTTTYMPNPVVHALGPNRWRSRLPEPIPGIYSTMIDTGALARVLAVLRDDGLLEGAAVGSGVLLDLEDEVIERYTGNVCRKDARQELQGFIQSALANVASLYDVGIILSPAQQDQCRKLAEFIHPQLSTRGSGERPSVEAIAALLQALVIKSGFQRQADWTLDFIAVKAGWGVDVGIGVSRISAADRNRISRFLRRICEDYGRDASGSLGKYNKPPVLPLIRCDRKGSQGIPSRYTFLWENWGQAFSPCCQTPCPPRSAEPMTDEELIQAGLLEKRRRK
jgi:hypothetical protein